MRKILAIFFAAIIMSGCDIQQESNLPSSKENIDTLVLDSANKKINEKAATQNNVFDNPYRDINNFYISVGDGFIDSLNHAESNRGYIEEQKNICVGDNCESYLIFSDEKSNPVFYFFKNDGGEYGFGNDQYFMINGSLAYARNFHVIIEELPTDSTSTIWEIKETTYDFRFNKLSSYTREVITNNIDQFDFRLPNVKRTRIEIERDKILILKENELKKHVERKNSEHRD